LEELYNSGDPENDAEVTIFLNKMGAILFPVAQNESILDTYGDLGNYGDIGAILHVGAWGKPLESK
jgi:hypothetical protein